jgi:hypothetical protein
MRTELVAALLSIAKLASAYTTGRLFIKLHYDESTAFTEYQTLY